MQIDKTKGISISAIPDWWDKWNKIEDSDDKNARERKILYNRILLDKRPYFMRYVYSHYNEKYKKHESAYENLCQVKFGFSLNELLTKKRNQTEEDVFQKYVKDSPLLDSDCVMNRLCHYLERNIKEIKTVAKHADFDWRVLINKKYVLEEESVHKMLLLLKDLFLAFQNHKKQNLENFDEFAEEVSSDEFWKELRKKAYKTISSNAIELSNLAILFCYRDGHNKDFVWKVFGEEIVESLLDMNPWLVEMPVLDKDGEVEYLGKRYKKTMVEI
jgi:hypothetical protein